ncbi:MAG: DUF481 domain-containing protein [Sideroxyarcus sp.]|nr:DUF481 domain-containing protein [Sideroxyarcus sp.]
MLTRSTCFLLAFALNYPTLAADDGIWQGSATLSFSRSAGNTNATTYSVALDEARATEVNKVTIYASTLYGKSQNEITADKTRIGGRYDHNLTERVFDFGLLEFERDLLADLKLRTGAAAGLGYHVIKDQYNRFDVFGGLSRSNSELITGPTISQNEMLWSEESFHKLTANTQLKQKFSYYPSIDNFAQFRTAFDGSLVLNLNSTVGLSISVQNKYGSDVGSGIKHSDTVFLTGLNIKL